MFSKNNKKAFTFSEVLIAMTVVGVLAVVLIPTLSTNSKRKNVVAIVRENFSILSNAYELCVLNHDAPSEWELDSGGTQKSKNINLANKFLQYLNTIEDCSGKDINYVKNNCYKKVANDSETAYVVLSNGQILGFTTIDANCADKSYFPNKSVCGEIDLILNTYANSYGKDVFQFFVTNKGVVTFGFRDANHTFKLGCNLNENTPYSAPFYNMSTCTAWVVYRENMDYLDCPGELDWNTNGKCK